MPDAPEGPGVDDDWLADLHLDDVVAALTTGREAQDLASFYRAPLDDRDDIAYRQAVFRDLEREPIMAVVRSSADRFQLVRDRLARVARVHHRYEQGRWYLDAAAAYRDAVTALADELDASELRSAGLIAVRDHLAGYRRSEAFRRLVEDIEDVRAILARVRYRLRIQDTRVTVSRQAVEPDYGAEVVATFEKFKEGAGTEREFAFERSSEMNHVEAAIVDRVALLEPEAFARLDEFRIRHGDFLDPRLVQFDREVQFYVAYLEFIGRLRRLGLPFCYPDIVERSDDIVGREAFDIALAQRLADEGRRVVTNDFEVRAPERILVVTGPNQGGKTTFARMIGQLHHLARIGAPVPGTAAQLPLVDRILTHFGRREQVEDLTSTLERDLLRIERMIRDATPDSLLILNESFGSTTLSDQLVIGRAVLHRLIEIGSLGVVVTFLDELTSIGPSTVSLVGTIDPDEPARRTFRIVRRPADGLAYAMAIAEKHRLTYPDVKARLAR